MPKLIEKYAAENKPPSNKSVETEMEDELWPEYDLSSLRVRKLGPGRRSFGEVIRLEPDVAEVFPNAKSVNEALRFLISVMRENNLNSNNTEGSA